MHDFNRRNFLKVAGVSGAAALTGIGCATNGMREAERAHVVVVGGGSGGATAAKYIKQFSPNMRVTLIEPNATYYTCYGSNWVIGGFAGMDDIAQGYDTLRDEYGIEIVQDRVTAVDATARSVRLAGGDSMGYDKLVMSPGIDFRYDDMPGISEADADRIPHAWKAGSQTELLRSQLHSMPNGGVFVMVAPPNPFRCPPGPYERVSLVAHYLKQEKPRSKIIILDPKDGFSKQGLFEEGWAEHYGDMIEWRAGSSGGRAEEIDVSNMTVLADSGFERVRADVLNFIPAQRAGQIAHDVGLTNDAGWVPVDQLTFKSEMDDNIYVLGDASVAGAMPKSGHSANNQGKIVAAAIVRELAGQEPINPSSANTCYSLVTPDYAVSVAAVYQYQDGAQAGVSGAGGVSPSGASASFRRREAGYTRAWYNGITSDIWG
ncbi:FCSD flavin-binding domain-containing protein [Thioalkalivibrio sp. ALMg11]|uniref:FCSD flavin-binding domain-containing protein n=1 Tax=Thioalkalivibrio sp. ALMg11 TaxID=1158165 RepID=UPI0003732B69|nr:FCSD flavin-binding domain-containing protein [Thioalkalivibrio sp. ALMg11]